MGDAGKAGVSSASQWVMELSNQPWIVHCDGSAVPNPGRMGLGAVVIAPGGARHTLSLAAESRGCNNEAELRAVMAALTYLASQAAEHIRVHCDNSVVVGQLLGTGEPIVRLAALVDEARAMLKKFAGVSLVWIPGHRNGEADALARAALRLPGRPRVRPAKKRR